MSIIKTDIKRASFERFPERALAKAGSILKTQAKIFAGQIRERWLTGGTTSTKLGVRSGRLRASCQPTELIVDGTRAEVGIQFGTVYGRVHIGPRGQKTKIVPKKGKYLAIPLPAAQTRAGVAKGSPRGGPWGQTFFATSKAGNLILFGKMMRTKGKGLGPYGFKNKVVPLFVMKKEVTIKARVHPEDILAHIRPQLINAFREKGVIDE